MSLTLGVVGSGGLARATCLALSTVDTLAGVSLRVRVLARNAQAAADLCHIAEVRAALNGRDMTFRPAALDPLALDGLAGVLVAASTQSPWEHYDRPSAWTALMRRAGFAVTLPFQAQLARAVRLAAPPGAFVVNACFPDAVNPLLAEAGVPVLAGTGNVGLVAAALQHALGLPDQSRLHLVAHHLHLHAPADPADEALAWLDGEPIENVGPLLAAQRGTERRGLNDVTGFVTAQLLGDLLTGATRDTHLPGVDGRPGGYPVRVSAGTVTLRLPVSVDVDHAVRVNERWGWQDGVAIEAGRVRFALRVAEALASPLPAYADGFAVDDLDGVTAALHDLRSRLRTTNP